jgi:hypothetical protein
MDANPAFFKLFRRGQWVSVKKLPTLNPNAAFAPGGNLIRFLCWRHMMMRLLAD